MDVNRRSVAHTLPVRLSLDEIRSLAKLKQGISSERIPTAHSKKFLDNGLVETKFGGIVLTSAGRFHLDVRERETGLPLLQARWRRRAEELNTIADSMSSDRPESLRSLAKQWEELAEQLEKLERVERVEPYLT
jgi:hypothetical protein